MTEQRMRRYHSPLRAQQAALTRAAVLDSAAAAFAQRGWVGTTLAAIAADAEVSLETVKALGTKGTLLLAAFERAFIGDALPPTAEQRIAALVELGKVDATSLLEALVDVVVVGNARIGRLWPALQAAAGVDEVVGGIYDDLLARRDRDLVVTVEEFVRRGWEPHDGVAATASAVGYLLAPESYAYLVEHAGWEVPRYRAWLEARVRDLFVTDR